jgi:hypothetical protein
MAEHGGGKDPISNIGGTLIGGVTGLATGIFVLGMLLGGITGNAPIKASVFDFFAWGQIIGAWIHVGGNASVETFGDEKYFQNSKKIGSDTKPDQRLLSPTRPPSANVLPTRSTTNDATITGSVNPVITTPYEDTNGDGVISPEEIAKQNKR